MRLQNEGAREPGLKDWPHGSLNSAGPIWDAHGGFPHWDTLRAT